MKKATRNKIIVTGMLVLLTIPLAGYLYLRGYLPDYSASLKIKGLTAPVSIKRNQYAVPFIEANHADDLYFAWGYVNAQDRMFQMEIIKRIGQGRISEFAGEEALSKDIFLRAIGFAEIARRESDTLTPQEKQVLQRFVDGINYYLDTHRKPLYFTLLGLKKEKWTISDPLLIAYMLNWSLAYNMKYELLYQKIIDTIGPQEGRKLLKLLPADTPTTIGDIQFGDEYRVAGIRLPVALLGGRSASNSWVLAPQKTKFAGALLANDPHMEATKIPGDFYLVRAKAKDLDVAGGQVAGVPFIATGYNRHTAWGVTNQGADVVDIFIENVDWQKMTYRRGEKDLPLTTRKVTIAVKGKPAQQKTLYYAGRRPLLKDGFPDLKKDVSIDWAGFYGKGHFAGFLALNRAKSHAEFTAAADRIYMSPQNMVYADVDGNIAYRTTGTLVKRTAGSGNYPQPVQVRATNWDGLIEPDMNPAALNPSAGFIASANNRVVRNFPYEMNATFAPRFRYERIAQMLRNGDGKDIKSSMQMQSDTRSVLALGMIPIIKRLVQVPADSLAEKAFNRVINWDGDIRPELPEPSIYNTWLMRFMYQTFKDELGAELAEIYVGERYIVLERFLELLQTESAFFDDIQTPAKETAADIASRAFIETVDILADFTGTKDIQQWQWTKLHQIRFDHLLGKSKLLRPFVNRGPYPLGGDGETNLRAVFKQVKPPFDTGLAAGLRMVVAFDPQPKGHLVLITGQNEYFLSEHYDDMTALWLQGKYFPVEEAKVRYHTLMQPG